MRCELLSWRRVERLSGRLAERILATGFRPDTIVGIGRGGWVPARLLCDLLDIFDLRNIRVEHYTGTRKHKEARVVEPLCSSLEGRRVLLVDDVSDSGDTYRVALDHLRPFGPTEIRTAALHHKTVSGYRPDHYAQEVREWRWLIYPWAVREDLAALVETLPGAPGDPPGIAERLRGAFGIRLAPERIEFLLSTGRVPDR